MDVQALWRYPVKSMRGQRLERADVRADGIAGDRLVQVVRGERVLTARTHPRLLGLQGGLAADGTPLVDGQPWDSPAAAAAVVAIGGPGTHLVFDAGLDRFDILPLLVATDGAIAALGEDGRRLRPNLVVGGVEGLAERTWPGRRLRSGAVEIGIDSLRGRCVVTTYDPDTLEQDPGVLRHIVRAFDGEVALNCRVARPGVLRAGDPVTLL